MFEDRNTAFKMTPRCEYRESHAHAFMLDPARISELRDVAKQKFASFDRAAY